MVLLGYDALQACDSRLNPVGDRERICRNLQIPRIENLALLRDTEEALDLTGNEIQQLEGFPLMRRLLCLMLSHNKISTIDIETARMLPNLQTLILSHNRISSFDEVEKLSKFENLQFLTLTGNPIAVEKDYRQAVIKKCPKLRFLDYQRVRASERSVST